MTTTIYAGDDRHKSSDGTFEEIKASVGKSDVEVKCEGKGNRTLLQGLRDLDKDSNTKVNNKFIEWLAKMTCG